MEHTSETVAEGKLLHETSYPQRAERYAEIEISASFIPHPSDFKPVHLFGKIDFYDAKNKVIHEIKKSDKMEEAHEWQVKFYIWLLELNEVQGAKAILEYPKLRETKEVKLTEADTHYLEEIAAKIGILMYQESCPDRINKKFCKKCAYFDLCYIED